MPDACFGSAMRTSHFNFEPSYIPLNHGSYGAFPKAVRERQREIQAGADARPDPFIRKTLPKLLADSRAVVAPLLGVPVNEVVFVPNATTAVNTVLRNLKYEQGDVILHFSIVYGACMKTIVSVCETSFGRGELHRASVPG